MGDPHVHAETCLKDSRKLALGGTGSAEFEVVGRPETPYPIPTLTHGDSAFPANAFARSDGVTK